MIPGVYWSFTRWSHLKGEGYPRAHVSNREQAVFQLITIFMDSLKHPVETAFYTAKYKVREVNGNLLWRTLRDVNHNSHSCWWYFWEFFGRFFIYFWVTQSYRKIFSEQLMPRFYQHIKPLKVLKWLKTEKKNVELQWPCCHYSQSEFSLSGTIRLLSQSAQW